MQLPNSFGTKQAPTIPLFQAVQCTIFKTLSDGNDSGLWCLPIKAHTPHTPCIVMASSGVNTEETSCSITETQCA